MKASVLLGPRTSHVKDVPVPEIGEEEVLVRVTLCGVCASEVQPWRTGEGAGHRIFGHEAVGRIEQIGARVVGLQIGDRVTGLMYQAFAEYTKAHYKDLIKVPDELEDIEALGEPLSCLISAADRTPLMVGESVAIIGAGFMGLGLLQLMRFKGAGEIIVIDRREEGLRHAARFGATSTFKPDAVPDELKVVRWDDIPLNRGVPVVAEVTGSQSGLDLAIQMTSVHGILSIVGYHQKDGGIRSVNMELMNWKGITVINAHERRNHVHVDAMKRGLALIRRGQLKMKELITHEFSLDEVDLAYSAIVDKPEGYVKSVIRINP